MIRHALRIGVLLATALPAHADYTTALVDNRRSGWDANEPALTPSFLASGHFGELFATDIEGEAYAQPLIFGSDVIVATEANEVYAIDTGSGIVHWRTKLGRPTPSYCYAASPYLGIHSTPVIDARTGALYVVARTQETDGPKYLVSALGVSDGHRLDGWPVEIKGPATNDPAVTFDPVTHLQRPALLLLDGSIYAAFGGYCGGYPFRGWVAGINVATKEVKLWTAEANASTKSPQAGISGAGGLVSDEPGSIVLATGDGTLPPRGDGPSPTDALGNSVVRLRVQGDGSLVAVDHFTPATAGYLNDKDLDLGTAAPLVLPDDFVVDGHPHLLLQVGKEGKILLLDRASLGGVGQGPGGGDATLAQAGPFGEIYGHPSAWPGDGGFIYVSESADLADVGRHGHGSLRAFRLEEDASAAPRLTLAGTASFPLGFGTGSPIITSAGKADGSAIVWLIQHGGEGDQLLAYSAVPTADGVLALLWSSLVGRATKFSVPASDSGRIFVATGDGHLLAFGDRRLAPPSTRLSFHRRWLVAIVAGLGVAALLVRSLRRT